MTTEIGNLSSANGASLQQSDKSGQMAAQLLSGSVEDTEAVSQKDKEPKDVALQQEQNRAEFEKQVQNLQDFGKMQGWTVNFSMEQESGQVVIKVLDSDTRSVIRQIPTEELIAIHKRIQALQQGEAGANPKLGLLLDSEI
ncbi:flagellar protein FlaG [Aeromonas hydrophila]|jgi:flagellar protein FlaG|uniref:flagellar protein FlaG n=1 Tax=Aeromonas hydrophila TaxID=644 RepID=UPI00049309F3|nr:flagellar protein FlaG [Aeromonas hydrophila]EJN6954493.1 flagellar protein FlaG [Aeromonas hydrophila]KER62354.1 flagellin [Aeromonas hydrophila]MBL0560685.1 flagellar protein FlaG [Aeromonas hydrophila]MCP3288340.1 flagellar protein FlaG [Aeromonas hydrophila]MCX4040716.1 flagellar protein FlaG [Aeromonas hydrophila]